MNTALVIMAAGLGSRYGGSVKQVEPVGPGGEILMEYAISDALRAGFDKLIIMDQYLAKGQIRTTAFTSGDRWFGLTFQEDKPGVKAALRELHDSGVYPTL